MKNVSLPTRSDLAGFGLAALVAVTMSPLAAAQINEDLKLLPSDGAADDYFGWSVSVNGATVIVGSGGIDSGAAYLFDAASGQQLVKLLPSDGPVSDSFGFSVAISGTTAIVGDPEDEENGINSGSIYVFDVASGQQVAKLLPSEGAADEWFGWSVAISGSIVVVGAYGDADNGIDSGSAYLFDAASGQQLGKLLPSDGSASDWFGFQVAISGTTVVVGAYGDDDNGNNSGSAYVFDVTTGQQIAKLLPKNGAADDYFEWSVAIDGPKAVVGAKRDQDNGAISGSAYVFDVTSGQQIAKLLPSDGASGDYFGISVAIRGTTAVVGAYGDQDNGWGSGSAYGFHATTGQQLEKMLPSDGLNFGRFGCSVSIGETTALVGAYGDDDNGTSSGSAYTFPNPDCNSNGLPDIDDIGNGSSQDCDSNGIPDECQIAENPSMDWNGDGVLDSCVTANYCVAENNSTGVPAVIGASGTPVALENNFTLEAWDLPPNEFAYFLASESTAFIPGFGGSSGNLCVGARQYRFNIPSGGGKILNSGSTGTVSFTLDLNLLPQGINFDPGETWYFQLWYRDFTTGPTSNTTDGIEVMFR